jgi:Fe2+ or Zn2+ uptake regulation protein
MMYLLKVIGIDTCVKLGDKLKTEGSGSKHVIVCDNCNKIFYFEKAYEEHKPCHVRHSKLKLDDQPRIL